ncbi:hypothetical protein COMNV_01688 [Commensalibacter sp. Nvir]|uniref:4'-phosphopantetheinyl transferase AcpT n=1 Tax=Commensalibacter sp. Nvir TaxID=3069817 RepID=UPI002D5D14F1|nr:hypothetical protein COMNV_01688 [Commensalibacter sp. Nvir]
MLRGNIAELEKQAEDLIPVIFQHAPNDHRRNEWLAGRVLLSQALYPLSLPEITYNRYGKPEFNGGLSCWFNISHSGNHIALLLSDEGAVGCDIEILRPRNNWQRLVEKIFSKDEKKRIYMEPDDRKLAIFWRIWTLKEAMLKQKGESLSRIINNDTSHPEKVFLEHCYLDGLSLAICTPTYCSLLL